MLRQFGALLAVGLAILAEPALAQQGAARFALLIGNQRYTEAVGPLRNPHNDIARVGKALAEVGFSLAEPVKDGKRDDMLFAVHDLAARLRKAGRGAIGFLYYTGHGVSIGSDNVLVPVNAASTSDAELSVRGVKLGEILDILQRDAPDAVHFVVLDACRNSIRGKRGAKGFVPVNEQRVGVVVAFATAHGQTASDEGKGSGPYAAALADEIVKPGHNDQTVFNAVRTRVVKATKTQTPWVHDGLVGERVVFKTAPEVSAAAAAIAPPPPTRMSEGAEAWSLIKDSPLPSALEAFIRRYGDTFYGDLARARLAELKRLSMAHVMPPPSPTAKRPAAPPAAVGQGRCNKPEVEVDAASGAVCIVPGSGVSFSDCAGCPEMVVVPAGQFRMGSPPDEIGRVKEEGPQHDAFVRRPFAIGQTPVSRRDYETFLAEAGHHAHGTCQSWNGRALIPSPTTTPTNPGFKQTPDHPVVCVSWEDATAYTAWFSKKTRRPYRLPSEVEREFATRAGSTTTFAWGPHISPDLAAYDWEHSYKKSAKKSFVAGTTPSKKFRPNRWGIYGLHGGVAEWTDDCLAPYTLASREQSSVLTGRCDVRIVRGGSWLDEPDLLRAATRRWYAPAVREVIIGFRLARDIAVGDGARH